MVPHRHIKSSEWAADLVSDTSSFHLGRITGRAGRHRVNHVTFGAGGLEKLHVEGVITVGADNFQGHGHGLFVEAHHADLVDDTFSIIADTGASIVHCFFSLEGETGQV